MKLIFLFVAGAMILSGHGIDADDSPGFFLKVTKNIPRLGRRSGTNTDFENFFLKASKSVPRIGRRDPLVDLIGPEENPRSWYDRLTKPSKRVQLNSNGYNHIQPVESHAMVDLLANSVLPPNDFKFVSWRDFDYALEHDDQLYTKLVSLAKDASQHYEEFIPINSDYNYNNIDSNLYYRADRSGTSANKEKIEYQM